MHGKTATAAALVAGEPHTQAAGQTIGTPDLTLGLDARLPCTQLHSYIEKNCHAHSAQQRTSISRSFIPCS